MVQLHLPQILKFSTLFPSHPTVQIARISKFMDEMLFHPLNHEKVILTTILNFFESFPMHLKVLIIKPILSLQTLITYIQNES